MQWWHDTSGMQLNELGGALVCSNTPLLNIKNRQRQAKDRCLHTIGFEPQHSNARLLTV